MSKERVLIILILLSWSVICMVSAENPGIVRNLKRKRHNQHRGGGGTRKGIPTKAPTKAPTSGFNIQLILSMPDKYKDAFYKAKDRWERVILGDLPGTYNYSKGQKCWESWTEQSTDIIVDDLLIFADTPEIDGVGRLFGLAGYCKYSQEGGRDFPRVGMMSFDEADLQKLSDDDLLDSLILHEMGHVIGIGTLWNRFVDDLTFEYTGANGVEANKLIGGEGNPNVEGSGGRGTALAHWDEDTYDNELMTGYTDPDAALSILTIQALSDLGYVVNINEADPYKIPIKISTKSPTMISTKKIKLRSLRGEVDEEEGAEYDVDQASPTASPTTAKPKPDNHLGKGEKKRIHLHNDVFSKIPEKVHATMY